MKRPVRLRVQQTRYPHWGGHSGISQYLRYLDPQAYRIDLRLAGDDDLDLPIPDRFKPWLRGKVQAEGMAWYKLSDFASELRLFAACAAGRADIVHFLDGEHSGQYLPEWVRMSPLRRPRLVASYHQPADLLPQLVPPQVACRFDRIVVVAPSQRSYFEAFMAPEKIVTILHGIDTEFFRPAAKPRDGIFRCISTGHWMRDWALVKAVADQVRDCSAIRFDVVTQGETGLEDLPNVYIHYGLDDNQLLELYQNADVLFLPLTASTANNSILEALACGLPIISNDLPDLRIYLADSGQMLFPKGDVNGPISAIRRLQSDPALRASLSTASRERATHLAWKKIAQLYDQLYRELLSGTAGRRA